MDKRYIIKPDLVFLDYSHRAIAVGDVKYKPSAKEEDRYQIISHALSYKVDKAILLYPSNSSAKGLVRLGSIGPNGNQIELFEYYFDVAADLPEEEKKLVADIGKLLQVLSLVTSATVN